MIYEVKVAPRPVWDGRTANDGYLLRRALISEAGSDFGKPGYVLYRNGEFAEAYFGDAIVPGSGIHEDDICLIEKTEIGNRRIQQANPEEVKVFASRFSEYCEANGDPLLVEYLML